MASYYNRYKMSPMERRARAQALVQYRENRSMFTKYLEEQEEYERLMREEERRRNEAQRREREKNNADFFTRSLSTVGDLAANVVAGAGKGIEGIIDFGAGLVGGIGGIFSDDFEDDVKNFVATDWTGTYIDEPLQEALRYSYLKDDGIIENVASGIGQMLPAVVVTVATGGAGAPAALGQALSLGTTMVSAAGNATEEAYKDGASYWAGLGYGTATGLVEGATEKLLGGATSKIFGAGIFDGVVRSATGEIAETGIKRIVKDAVGEAFEEAVAELANPALKSIYKGRDAFSEYGNADYWKGVMESAAVGGLTSVAYGGTVGRAMKTSGKYADISGALEANENISNERLKLYNRGNFTADAEAEAARAERQNLMSIERTLKNSSESKRAELMKRFALDATFEADGSIKEAVLKKIDSRERSVESKYKREYYSPELRGDEDIIESDLAKISKKTGVEAKVFSGELSETAQKNYSKTKRALGALNKKSKSKVSLVITEANDAYKGGLVDGRTLYMSADQLDSEDFTRTLVHEFTHFEEGTKEYADMMSFLQSDDITVDDGKGGRVKLWQSARDSVLSKDYGISEDQLSGILQKVGAGEAISEDEKRVYKTYATELVAHETETVLGNEQFIDKIIAENGTAAEKLVSKIISLDKAFSSMKDKQSRAQAKLIRQAEGLYLKAAEAAGNKRIVKMILAHRSELEEELTSINEEKMQVGESNETTTVQFARKGNIKDEETESAKEQLRNHLNDVNKMDPVVDINYGVISKERARQDALSLYNQAGKKIDRKDFGIIELSEKELNESANYLNTPEEFAAWMTIPRVLKRGKLISGHENHKHEGFPTYTIAAPVVINGERGNVVVVVKKTGKYRYKVHRILMPDGSRFIYKDIKIDAEPTGSDIAFKKTSKGPDISSASTNSISQSAEKSTENAKKVSGNEKDLQMSLKKRDDLGDFFADEKDSGPVYKVSGGKVRKVIADNTRMKVYTRAESEAIINQIVSEQLSFGELYGSLGGKSKREAVDILWNGLNSADPGEQGKVALDVAEYIINNAAVESIYDGEGVEVYRDIIAALKPYLHTMELSSIKGDIKSRYGKDSSPYLLWNKRRGEVGLSPEAVAAELNEIGFKIDAENPADILISINDAYRDAVAHLKKEAKAALNAGLTAEERKKLKQDIAREVLNSFESNGSPSKFAGIVNKYIKEANVWKDKYHAERGRNEAINRVLKKTQKLKDLKTDAFLNATEHKPHLFKGSIEKLSKIEVSGNLNKSGTRKIVADLAEWYVKSNPMLEDNHLFDEEIEAMLHVISHGQGQLSTDEVKMLGDVIDYFSHFVQNYNKIYRNGKYEDAKPIAERYVKQMRENAKLEVGFVGKISGSGYLKLFGDPMTIMRRLDMYENGFYTEMMEQLREGAIGASVMEMEIREPLEEFLGKHKNFLNKIRERKVKYGDFEMAASQAMLYYMTLNRKQALAGLAKSGFAYLDGDKTVRVPGFSTGDIFELDNLVPAAKAEQKKLYDQFTDAEREYIKIAEKIFNEDCKEAKRETDMKRKGFSNALEGYYVPIRRGNIAKSVDSGTFFDEMNRASNASFNKDTVTGAKNELFIGSLDSVLDSHIRGVSQYANLALVIDQYDTIFNMAINNNPNKPDSVRSESANVWREGEQYFKNVISDIQGIPVESRREGYQFLKQLRSGYAKYQLGANPKVWVTQLSSFAAAGSILDVDSITRGLGVSGADVDKYCALAKLRNSENTVAMAQGLFDEHSKPGKVLEATSKIGDALMIPIGKVDRFVVTKLFGACQVQVEKNGGGRIGTKANKEAAGELLQKVILETQQNATATDRSAAMRSGNELMKTITMFTADSMKVMGRVIDSCGEVSTLKARIKNASGAQKAELQNRLDQAKKQAVRSTASLVSSAAFMAVVAQMFRTLYNKDDEDENIIENMTVDAVGNLLGGLPVIKDVYGFFADGYGIDNYAYSAVNDMLESARDIYDVVGSVATGEFEGKELTASIKKMSYAAGQVLGLPTRNAYNAVYGIIKRVSPSTAYVIDDMFYDQSYRADLTRAIERGDEDMIATIAGLMLDDNVGGVEDSKARQELDRLVTAGFDVIPRGVGDSITIDGEEYLLSAADKKEFKRIYSAANEALADLVKLPQFANASDEVKAKAINYIYKVYWDLALQDLIGEDLETKTVLFAEAIPIEKLALIVSTAATMKADTDKKGKSISGSRKKKVQEYVNSLNLKAVEKYMIMGYLGYKNVRGEGAVKAYINKMKLTKSEKEKLVGYCGY